MRKLSRLETEGRSWWIFGDSAFSPAVELSEAAYFYGRKSPVGARQRKDKNVCYLGTSLSKSHVRYI